VRFTRSIELQHPGLHSTASLRIPPQKQEV
jgi:hypothetical protein